MRRTPLARKTPLRSHTKLARTPIRKRSRKTRRTLAVYDSKWLEAVRSIEFCVRCGKYGTEAAHADIDKGAGMKTDDCTACALCNDCHFALGNGKDFDREYRRSEMDRCLRLTVIAMFRAGKIGACA
jgi:uncharacterized protein YuzB (UPF0349 family)